MKKFFVILITFFITNLVSAGDRGIKNSFYYTKIKDLDLPRSIEEFQAIEDSIEQKMDSITKLIGEGSYGQALKDATNLRNNVRSKLIIDHRSNDDITINIKSIDGLNVHKSVLNYAYGFFPEMLNFYKRVEMLYTYAMIKRYSSGTSLNEKDKELVQSTLSKVYNSIIKIKDDNGKELVAFEDDILSEHFTYAFRRELEHYFIDLGYNSLNLEQIANNRKQSVLEKEAAVFCYDSVHDLRKVVEHLSGNSSSILHFFILQGKTQKDYFCNKLKTIEQVTCGLNALESFAVYKRTHDRYTHTMQLYNPILNTLTQYNLHSIAALRDWDSDEYHIADNNKIFDDHINSVINSCTNKSKE